MTARVFFFSRDHGDWILVKAERDGIIQGWVVNGRWNIAIDTNLKMAWVVGHKREAWSYEVMTGVQVPADEDEDYNEVIERARRKLNERRRSSRS